MAQLEIFVYTLVVAGIEFLVRWLANVDSTDFIGPTLAAAGAAYVITAAATASGATQWAVRVKGATRVMVWIFLLVWTGILGVSLKKCSSTDISSSAHVTKQDGVAYVRVACRNDGVYSEWNGWPLVAYVGLGVLAIGFLTASANEALK